VKVCTSSQTTRSAAEYVDGAKRKVRERERLWVKGAVVGSPAWSCLVQYINACVFSFSAPLRKTEEHKRCVMATQLLWMLWREGGEEGTHRHPLAVHKLS
jgi:hypothetical protein